MPTLAKPIARFFPIPAKLERRIAELEAALDERGDEVARLNQAIAERDARIAALEKTELELYILRSDHQRTVELADRSRKRVSELEESLDGALQEQDQLAAELARSRAAMRGALEQLGV